MTDVDPDMSLRQLVNRQPSAAPVLQDFSLDFCCDGSRPLGAAYEERGVEVAAVAAALGAAAAPAPVLDWVAMVPAELVDHLEATHHAYLRQELPRLDAFAEKVAVVHGGRHPELLGVLADFRELTDDLVPHLATTVKPSVLDRRLLSRSQRLVPCGARPRSPSGVTMTVPPEGQVPLR